MIANAKFTAEAFRAYSQQITEATVEVYRAVNSTLVPTASHPHYVFNMRDVFNVFKGLSIASEVKTIQRMQVIRYEIIIIIIILKTV